MDRITSFLSDNLPVIPATWPRPSVPDNWSKYAFAAAGGTLALTGAAVAWKSYQYRGLPPGPRGGLMGATHLVNEKTFDFDVYELSKKYGDVFSVRLGSVMMIILASHDAIKDAFVKQGDTFAYRGDEADYLKYFLELQDDIFTKPYKKDGWHQTKSAILGCLRSAGFGQTKSTDERIVNEFEKLTAYLEPFRLNKRPIDLREVLPKVTINVIFQILFSKELDYDEKELDESRTIIRGIMDAFTEVIILRLVPKTLGSLLFRKSLKRMQDKMNPVRALVRKQITAHLTDFDPENPRDFVDHYIAKFGRDDIPRMVDNIMMFVPDACDTLAFVMEWVLLYVTYYPDVQMRIAKEILKETGGSRHVNWSDRAKFPFTEATIREVMRISSVFNMTAAHAVDQDTIFRGYRIPKGVDVYGLLYAVHRDPNIYPNPDKFNPDRFIDSDGTLLKNDTWIPFSMGRRKCLGEQLVQIESFMIIANLLQKYILKFPEGASPSLEPDTSTVFRIPEPFTVILEERNQIQ